MEFMETSLSIINGGLVMVKQLLLIIYGTIELDFQNLTIIDPIKLEGLIEREEAMRLVLIDNQPKVEAIEQFCELIS